MVGVLSLGESIALSERHMASRNITSDSGISLFPEKKKTKIAVRVAQSSSDSEGSSDKGTARDSRNSRRTSRIPIQGLHQSSGSDVSEDDHEKIKPTDSGGKKFYLPLETKFFLCFCYTFSRCTTLSRVNLKFPGSRGSCIVSDT